MSWSSTGKQNAADQEQSPDFVKKAGGLVSKFLQRRKRFSTVVVTGLSPSPNENDAVDSGNLEEPFSAKPSVIAVPTTDRSNTTRSQISCSDSGHKTIHVNGPSFGGTSNGRDVSNPKRHKTGQESGIELPGSKERRLRVPSKPYKATCYAIISEHGNRCSLPPLAKGRYCEMHSRKQYSDEFQSRCHSEACDEREKWFFGDDGTSKCLAITASHRRCEEISVRHFDMCRRHLKYPPKRCVSSPESLPKLGEHVMAPEDDDDDESSGEYASSDSESDLETDLSGDDMSSDDSDDEGSSITSSDDDWEGTPVAPGVRRPKASMVVAATRRRATAGASTVRRLASSCSVHKKNARHVVHSKLRARRAKESTEFHPFGVFYKEPSVFDHSRDKLFSGERNQLQCHFESSGGSRCPYQRKRGTDIYCYGHDVLTPQVLEIMLNSGVEVDFSDRDCNSIGISSDEQEETYPPTGKPRPYTHKEFVKLWKNFEDLYMSTDEIESSKQVRGANQSMCPSDTDGQAKAQYGRLLPRAMKRIIDDILCVNVDDVFLDIGHGIGNTCMHVAFTVGCEARGIEVVYSRNSIATAFLDNLVGQHRQFGSSRIVGEIKFRHGRLEDEIHREFLTIGVTKAIVNNFNGVFAERSVKNKSLWFLDDYCAGIFALMAPGTSMVTLHPLSLGPSLEQANAARRKHKLPESSNASFYSVEQVVLGKACDTVKWNQKSGNENLIQVYKYTRLQQEAGSEAVFLCCNPQCMLATDNVPIRATTFNDEGRCVISRCECGVAAKMLRHRQRITYS